MLREAERLGAVHLKIKAHRDPAPQGRTILRAHHTSPCHRRDPSFVSISKRCVRGTEEGRDMQTDERVRQEPRQELMVPDLLERVIFVGVGSAIWITGFMLMLSILLVFIGLPLFFFGLAMTEAGLKGWR
jgi:hypothetical protein